MTVGGTGCAVLEYRGSRIALLQPDPGHKHHYPSQLDWTRFGVYETWNPEGWSHMAIAAGGGAFKGLQEALVRGQLGLAKLIRMPNNKIQKIEYDLTGVEILDLSPTEQVAVPPVGAMPKLIRFHSPHVITTPTGGKLLPPKGSVKKNTTKEEPQWV